MGLCSVGQFTFKDVENHAPTIHGDIEKDYYSALLTSLFIHSFIVVLSFLNLT